MICHDRASTTGLDRIHTCSVVASRNIFELIFHGIVAQYAVAVLVELSIHIRSSLPAVALLSHRTLLSSDFSPTTKPPHGPPLEALHSNRGPLRIVLTRHLITLKRWWLILNPSAHRADARFTCLRLGSDFADLTIRSELTHHRDYARGITGVCPILNRWY